MRLERLTLRELLLPLNEPFRISSGTQTSRRILLLELEDAEGTTVWSECVAPEEPNYNGETIDTAWHRPRAMGGAAGAGPLLRRPGGGVSRPAAQLPRDI